MNSIDSKLGTWDELLSRFLYHDIMNNVLSHIKIPDRVADYGGANGLIKEFIPHAITIDINPEHNPDILDNVITHKGDYDLIIMRYLLHYLSDYEVIALFDNIQSFHDGEILIIQFVNNELVDKYRNSVNEKKYFRTESQLEALLPSHRCIYEHPYTVTKEFYKHRLNSDSGYNHNEKVKIYLCTQSKNDLKYQQATA